MTARDRALRLSGLHRVMTLNLPWRWVRMEGGGGEERRRVRRRLAGVQMRFPREFSMGKGQRLCG